MVAPKATPLATSTDFSDLVLKDNIPETLPHLFPTVGGWNWKFKNRKTNGIERAVVYIGNSAFISMPKLHKIMSGDE